MAILLRFPSVGPLSLFPRRSNAGLSDVIPSGLNWRGAGEEPERPPAYPSLMVHCPLPGQARRLSYIGGDSAPGWVRLAGAEGARGPGESGQAQRAPREWIT